MLSQQSRTRLRSAQQSPMHWEDSPPKKAINFGAAFGVPENPTLFRVSILRVSNEDPLPIAFTEFWRRILSAGVEESSDDWEVLLFQLNVVEGGFTCVFTSHDLERDEPPVFKLRSSALEEECSAIPFS